MVAMNTNSPGKGFPLNADCFVCLDSKIEFIPLDVVLAGSDGHFTGQES